MEAVFLDELNWNYKLAIHNNSEHHAYEVKLIKPAEDYHFLLKDKINHLKPILANSELELRAEFYKSFEGKRIDANNLIENHPYLLMNDKFILEYTNIKGTKFYTIFDMAKEDSSRNQFVRKIKLT